MAEGEFFEKIEKIKLPIRILILVLTLVLIGGAFFFLVYQPKADEIARTRNDIGDLNRKIMKARINAKKLPQWEAEEKRVDAQFKEALKLLPDKAEIPSLLKNITQLGADSKLEFLLFSPKRETAEAFYFKLPVSVQVSGRYHDVALFFDKVGRMERIVNILNVSMKPMKANSTDLITNCEAVTYRFKGKTDGKPKKKKK